MSVKAEIDPADGTKILLTAESRYNTVIRTLDGASFRQGVQWHLPLTWQACLAMRTMFKNDLELGPNLFTWAKSYRTDFVDPLMKMRTQLEAPGYPFLYPFQRAGVQFLATARRAFLCDGLGSGKTIQALSTIRYLYEQGEDVFPVLIACPNSTKIAWAREATKVWPGLVTSVIKGSAVQRRKAIEKPAHIYIINWESLKGHSRLAPYGSIGLKKCETCGGGSAAVTETQCQVHLRELNKINFKTVIGDEIHRIKDAKTQQARAFKAATGDAEFRFGLSGTPIASAPDDLWSPLNWLMPKAYKSSTKYTERFLEVSINAWGATTVTGIKRGMEAEFFGGIDPHLRRMPKEVVLPMLPPVITERRDVEMSPKQRKAYKQMKEQMVAELDDNQLMVTTSPLTKMTRLLQFSSSFAELEWRDVLNKETGQMERKAFALLKDPSCKLDAFMTDIDDFADESVVVFAVSSQLINMLSERLTKRKIGHSIIIGGQDTDTRQENMDQFQEGKVKFILCTIGAGGTGVTLTRASTMVFLQRSWSMIDNVQAEGRGHRIGSEIHERIKIIDYVTLNSSEEVVFSAVSDKSDQLETILRDRDLLRRILENDTLEEPEKDNGQPATSENHDDSGDSHGEDDV